MSARSDDDLFDPAVAAWLTRAAGEITVDLDREWLHLTDRIRREARELAEISPVTPAPDAPPARDHTPRSGWGGLLAVAVVIFLMLVVAGPVFVRTTVTIVRVVGDAVEAPTTTTTSAPPPTAPPATVPLPPVTTTTPPAPTTTTDLAHAPILDGDEYRLTLRQVHDQLNAAIGFGRQDYAALAGADALIEGLLGQRPEYDAELRDTIGHLRQAMRANDRNAASAAHTIIDRIQRETAEG